MKVIVCPSCEKKLKVPDSIASKGSFKCPACGQTLKVPKPAKPKDDDLIELEQEDLIDEDLYEEEEERPRRTPKSSRGETRPAGRKSKSKGSTPLLGIAIGAGAVVVAVAIAAVFLLAGRKADIPIAQQNVAPPVNVVPANVPPTNNAALPNVTSPVSPLPDANNVPAQATSIPPATPVPSAPVNPVPSPVPSVPAQPAPAQPTVAANPNGALRYKWQPNREYPYKFSIEANLGEVVERTEGVCIYRVSPQPAGPVVEFKQQASGTALPFATIERASSWRTSRSWRTPGMPVAQAVAAPTVAN